VGEGGRVSTSAKRRALVFNHFAAPVDQPGGTRHVELAALVEGWELVVVAADRNLLDSHRRAAEPPGFLVVAAPGGHGRRTRMLAWVAYAVGAWRLGRRADGIDLVVGSTPHPLAARAAAAVAAHHHVPFVLEVRDPWPEALAGLGAFGPGSVPYRAIASLTAHLEARADAIVVLAEGVRDHLVAKGIDADRIHVVPNGADPVESTADRPATRARLGWADDEVVAVYAGAHGPANGLDLLLDAAAGLGHEGPALRVVLVGDGAEKPRLQARVEHEGLDRVQMLDPVPKQDVATLLAAADVGVHCLAATDVFSWGVSPNKLFDYLAVGLPVVTNTPGEVAALVTDADAGLAVEPAGLEGGLRTVADWTPEARRTAGDRGRTWLGAHRSRAALAHRFEAVLDGVLSTPRTAAEGRP